MCRWLAYSGSPILLEELLYKPEHSLIDQSLHSRLGVETTNGDGFGVGWYGSDTETPAVFHSIEPAWNDRNLREVAGHVQSPLFLAHIRASTGTAVQQTNCHPFRHGRSPWTNRSIHKWRDPPIPRCCSTWRSRSGWKRTLLRQSSGWSGMSRKSGTVTALSTRSR